MSPLRARRLLAVVCLVVVAACGPGEEDTSSARPTPSPRGVAVGAAYTLTVPPEGGSASSADGRVTVVVPAGAVSAPIDVTFQEITNTAPGGIGTAYRILPEGTLFAIPITVTFQAAPADPGIEALTVAYQEQQGFWLRYRAATRDALAKTISVTTTHLSDWSLVARSPRDMRGTFQIDSTILRPFTATGDSTLSFAGEDATASYFLQWGSITLDTPIVDGATTCDATDPTTLDLHANIAEVMNDSPRLRWGVDGHWGLACTTGGVPQSELLTVVFDTLGVNYISCTNRGYVGTPIVEPDHLAGTYTIDCAGYGAVTATWDFRTCTPDVPCQPTNLCRTGATTCDTLLPVCSETGDVPNGTSCGTDQVCNGGTCVVCVAGAACSTNQDQCVEGVTSCATGVETCENTTTPVASMGTACTVPGSCYQAAISCVANQPTCAETTTGLPPATPCPGGVCNGSGACNACTADQPCTTNSDQCVQGVTSCATGAETCENTTTPVPSMGTGCTVDGSCYQGAISCVANLPICTETAAALPPATPCPGGVCNGSGACNACTAGQACATNSNQCVQGVTSCATGAQTCEDTATPVASMGTTCTVAGSCYQGAITCSANQPTCTETTTPLPPATPCPGGVCNGGACNACTAGVACTTNSNHCVQGVTSCATGAQTCENTATPVASMGTTCTVAGSCYQGAIACVANEPICTETTTGLPPATPCPGGVCNGSGVCTACSAGQLCATNANHCVEGVTSCATGAQTCEDTATPVASMGTTCTVAGSCYQGAYTCVSNEPTCTVTATPLPPATPCPDGVCNGSGFCNACTQGASCTASAPCHTAAIECGSGSAVCTDNGNATDGTSCPGGVCGGGTCNPCTEGGSCTPANPCHAGTTACGSGFPVCVDAGTNVGDGTSCPGGVCGGGTCNACTQGETCTSSDPCHTAAYECGSGFPVCTDSGNVTDGTSCPDGVCGGGTCNPCTEGAGCTPTANECHVGTTACGSGSPVCNDTGGNAADGSSCSIGTCNAGTCTASRTVTGTRLVTYWLDSGAQAPVVARDVVVPPLASVEALFPDGSGGFVSYLGTFSLDGSFSIPNVPVGSYWLLFAGSDGAISAFETSSDVVDLGYDQLGRSDAAVPTGSTPVTFDLTPPLAVGDVFQASASNADVHVSRDVGVVPQDGTVDWYTGAGAPLNLLTAADVLYVHQLAPQTATSGGGLGPTYAYRAAGSWASVTGTVIDDLVAEIVTTTLGAASQTGSVPVAWSLSEFEAYLAQMGPSGIAADAPAHTLSIGASAHPLTTPAPLANGTPELLRLAVPYGSTPMLTTDAPLAYGQFLGAPWTEWREVSFTGHVIYTKLPAVVSLDERATVGRREQMPAATPLAPTLGPVQNPLVAGGSVFTPPAAVGLAPTFSWSAPTLGAPSRYTLTISRLDEQAGVTVATRVASWTTANLQVAVPAGILVAGQTYYARIVASTMAGDSFGTAPFRASPLSSYATTLTAPFTP